MTNRLAQQTSPYLLQHQHNPVDWYPWGPEALARAQQEDRPILLSVGYSACHWCHVMERESFEDEATAAHMNAHFVNVKVDREERPDLDEIYMRAVQAFSGGHGGWPMTVFLTPAGVPFYAGTYFPPSPRQGMPSFRQVMDHALRLYREEHDQLSEVTDELQRYLEASGRLPPPGGETGEDWLEAVYQSARADFDAREGGFGGAPKFPPHGTLAVLLAHHHRTGNRDSLRLVTATLDAMARGGMYDQLAGGFARYSVDGAWRIPHFEKMLYDNAQLLGVYTDAWRLTGSPLYERVVRETVEWMLTELRDPAGGFWSALDADSEGEEGLFYTWTPRELAAALADTPLARHVAELQALLEVTEAGNFEHGRSVLRLARPISEQPAELQDLFWQARPLLAAFRARRVRPGTDDKVLTAWNAMAIGALARAAAALDEEDWFQAAADAADFLLSRLRPEGRLLRTWRADEQGGRAHLLAYADDHAALIQALVDLYEADFDPRWLTQALGLAQALVDLFWDPEEGGLFYAGRDAEALVSRSKHMMGGAEPAANGVAALAFLRLAALCDRPDLAEKAALIVRCYQPLVERAPRALGAEALAAAWLAGPTAELGIVGPFESPDTVALLDAFRRRFLPFAVVAVLEPEPTPGTRALLPWMEGRRTMAGRSTAWLCQDRACSLPTQDPADLARQLDEATRPVPPTVRPQTRAAAPPLPTEPIAWVNRGAPLSLAELQGSVVVLHFWTGTGITSQHQLAELAALEDRLADQAVVVVGVHSPRFPTEAEPATVRRAVRRLRVQHTVVSDADRATWQAYEIQRWPTIVILDAQGRIAWRQAGEVRREELRGVVEGLLEEGRSAGILRKVPRSADPTTIEDTLLDHPGKVHIFPDSAAQAQGADPFGPDARLYISDTGHNRIIECSLTLGPDGWPRIELGRTFGSGTEGLLDARAPLARFWGPQGLARAGQRLWVADTGNHALRCIDLETGAVRTVAGTGELGPAEPSPSATRTPPRSTALRSPWDVVVVGGSTSAPQDEVVLVAMAGQHQVWVYLSEHEKIGPFAGSGREDHVDGSPPQSALAQPSGLALFGRYLFIVDAETSSVRAFDLGERRVGTVVGRGLDDHGDVDGAPDQVRLQHPLGIAVAEGELYVADTLNGKIKAISLQGGQARTLAGQDGSLCDPGGLAVAGDFLLVADTSHHEIKAIHRQTGQVRALRFH